MRFLDAAQFDDGRRIEPLIGTPAFDRLTALLREQGVSGQVIERIKPWAALANLTITPTDYAGETIDQKLLAMAHRLYLPLRRGGGFIAVGANHLYGEEGLLGLIEKQGYGLERAY